MKNRWHTLIAVLALGAFTSIADASPPPRAPVFPPVDQAARDPAFLDFLENLRALVRARDADAVAAHADPDIKLSFGGAYGRESFHQSLSENPTFGGASYWQELQRVLDLGGVFDAPDAFCTPYIFWPADSGLRDLRPLRNAGRGRSERANPRRAGRRLENRRHCVLRRCHDDRQHPLSLEPSPCARRGHTGDRGLRLTALIPLPHRLPRGISRCSTTAAG